MTDQMVQALLHERAGYARAGLKGRVAQVDEQLKLRGYTPDPVPDEPVARTAPPKKRAPRPRSTAKKAAPGGNAESR